MRLRSRHLLCLLTFAAPSVSSGQDAQRPALDFSSVVFGNFQVRTDSQAEFRTGGKADTRFDIARAYLTFRMPAGDRASVRITTDVFQQTNPAAAAYYGGWSIRLKYGILQYDFTKNLAGIEGLAAVGRIGMLQTVVIEHIETFWPRWLGNTAVELGQFFASADVGAASLLTLPNRRGEVYVTLMNGPGYTSAETDRFKDVAARFSFTPFANDSGFLRTFTITPWYYKGWSASRYTQAATPVSEGLQKDRRGIFLGVRDRRLTLGVEFDQRLEDVETTQPPAPRGPVADRTSNLTSAFAVARPAEWFDPKKRSRFGLVGRLDQFKVDTDAEPYDQFVVLGATWELTQRVTLALDYQGRTPKNDSPTIPTKTWFLHWVATF